MVDRIHVWHYVLNEEGQPVEDANIRLHLSNSTTEANIFVTETSSSYTTCSVADIKTNSEGFFEFWLAGNWETGGYDFSQLFRLRWYRPGIKQGYINNYNPWPNILTWVNTPSGGDVSYRNKFVSNTLVNTWLSHASGSSPQLSYNSLIPSASIHGISKVDYSSGCNNNDYNKVVSNEFFRNIIEKCDLYDSISLSGGVPPNGGFFPSGSEIIEVNSTIPSGTWNVVPSGSWMVSGSPSGTYYYEHFNVTSGGYVFLVNTTTHEEVTPTNVFTMPSGTRIVIDEDINAEVSINIQK